VRTEPELAARRNNDGEERGKPTRTLGGHGSNVKGHNTAKNVGFALVEAAFFDLDKTVIATSSVMALGGTFYRDGLISKRTIVRGLYAQVVYLLVGADDNKMERMREAMLALTKGWDQQHVQELVRETLDVVITPIIYAEALDLIEEHRKAGRKTVIVSSSPAETVEPIGEYLGVDDVIATRARLDEKGHYTGELEFYAYASHKADAVREMAVAERLDLASSYAYSDSITDLPMLELVGHPVAVNPDRELARVAREREWEVLYFQRPVRLRDRVPVPPKGPTLAAGGFAIAAGAAVAVYVGLRRRASAN
jgi:HAD superfamily hydrolase (TIGR01490 family)